MQKTLRARAGLVSGAMLFVGACQTLPISAREKSDWFFGGAEGKLIAVDWGAPISMEEAKPIVR